MAQLRLPRFAGRPVVAGSMRVGEGKGAADVRGITRWSGPSRRSFTPAAVISASSALGCSRRSPMACRGAACLCLQISENRLAPEAPPAGSSGIGPDFEFAPEDGALGPFRDRGAHRLATSTENQRPSKDQGRAASRLVVLEHASRTAAWSSIHGGARWRQPLTMAPSLWPGPKVDEESIARAWALGYRGDDECIVWEATRAQDVLHTVIAEAQDDPWSPTLRAVAHGYALARRGRLSTRSYSCDLRSGCAMCA